MAAINLKLQVNISVYLRDVSKPVMKGGQGAYTVDPALVFGQQDHPSNVSRQYGSEIEIRRNDCTTGIGWIDNVVKEACYNAP